MDHEGVGLGLNRSGCLTKYLSSSKVTEELLTSHLSLLTAVLLQTGKKVLLLP